MYVLRDLEFEELVRLVEEALGIKILESGMTPEGYMFRFERDLTPEEAAKLAALTGQAVFKEASPPTLVATPMPVKTFRDEVRKKLEEMKASGEISEYCVEAVDEDTKTAKASVYIETTEGLKEERRLLVKKDDKIEVKKIV